MELARAAGDFLVAAAERLMPGTQPVPMRTMLDRACGGQLSMVRADGSRASGLTVTGIPFEASVTGGRGQLTPALRYVTEAGTLHADFGSRLTTQLQAIDELCGWPPNDSAAVSNTLRSFVAALFPNPAAVPTSHRFATWLGVAHHAGMPGRAAALKLYGSLTTAPETFSRLCTAFPEFAELTSVPKDNEFIRPHFAAIEMDAHGVLSHKVYLRVKFDIATPMKLVRLFGDPAWEVLSELVRCGVDPASLHRFRMSVCCASRGGAASFALHVGPRHGEDPVTLIRELAERHHGTTAALDALAEAAESVGASCRYSVVGLGASPHEGIDKLNLYCTPVWDEVAGPVLR